MGIQPNMALALSCYWSRWHYIYLPDASGLHAISPDGTVKWTIIESGSPAVGSDGTIYLARHEEVIAINPNGSTKWTFDSGNVGDLVFPPSIGINGTIYVGYAVWGWANPKFYALNPDGTEKWAYNIPLDGRLGPCAIGPDGAIYFGLGGVSNGRLYALTPAGSMKWEIEMEAGHYPDSPAIGADGTLYVGWGSNFFAISSDGAIEWEVGLYEWHTNTSSPAIAEDGTIYVMCQNGNLYALSSDSPGLATCPWPMYMHDARHTASVQTDVGNNPPVANAGPDQTVEVGEDCMASITLDGSGSSDPDEDSLTYSWTWNGGSAPGVNNPTILVPR